MGDDSITLPQWIRLAPLDDVAGDALVRGSACRTRADLFQEWAQALAFPDHFGHNWDAFADCVIDLAWPDVADPNRRRDAPVVVTVSDAAELLIDEPPGALTTFLAVLDDAATGRTLGRTAARTGLLLVLPCEARPQGLGMDEFVRRLQAAWADSAG
jgi:hypothetical protein